MPSIMLFSIIFVMDDFTLRLHKSKKKKLFCVNEFYPCCHGSEKKNKRRVADILLKLCHNKLATCKVTYTENIMTSTF